MERRVRRLRRLLTGGVKFGPGGLGRPVQIADDRARRGEQNQNLDQQDSSDRRPKALASLSPQSPRGSQKFGYRIVNCKLSISHTVVIPPTLFSGYHNSPFLMAVHPI